MKKIRSQVAAWKERGAEVEIFCVSTIPAGPLTPMVLQARCFLYRRRILGRLWATRALAKDVERYRPDVLYVRYSLFVPPLRGIVRRFPTVVEINSNDRTEYRLTNRRVALYNEFHRRLLLGNADGLAFVTAELATSGDFRDFAGHNTVVSNGITLAPRPARAPRINDRPVLVFLAGSPGPWHGIDKILRLASHLPEFDFEILGAPVIPGEAPANVVLRPLLGANEYEALLARADVAVASLGLHRKCMNEAAPLKVREYLLHGLPVITAYRDPDLRGPLWFVLQLPNYENNVEDHVDTIRQFVHDVAGKRASFESVAGRIDIRVKEAARLDYIERLHARVKRGAP